MTIKYEIPVDGHRLVALSFNPEAEGVPVILMHGITSSVYFWTSDLVEPFIGAGPCYALSLPGHYPASFPSDFRRESLTAEGLAEVLAIAIRQLVGERPVMLVGHSTGGFAALDIAAHAPDMAHFVISISGFAQGRWRGVLGRQQRWVRDGLLGQCAFKFVYKSVGLSRTIYRAATRFYSADPHSVHNYRHFDALLENSFPAYRKLDLEAMIHYFTTMPDVDISEKLPRISVPTLALTGDRDPIVPPTQAHLIAERVPRGELVVIENVGHTPFYERPDVYRRTIETWLMRHG
ncbi:MAG TPA: alpha/beta hydrolase [Chloroflexi bacterium]|nr:alpha/beta hydrolase [Chloroflexota bacterium]